MHAIQVTEHGGPEVMRFSELETPSPAKGEVLVRVEAAGVNFIDVSFARERTRSPCPPFWAWKEPELSSSSGPM